MLRDLIALLRRSSSYQILLC
ncbi:BnaA02g05860D [Brassica napus]|uniref:BnaA02g05860D protein n=2 Tax=Brassica TaxID=3705 RepID=A0A078F3T7_BRANA|nr:BnaA02g05860D [Brassica napus]